jgi:hypothetical protein
MYRSFPYREKGHEKENSSKNINYKQANITGKAINWRRQYSVYDIRNIVSGSADTVGAVHLTRVKDNIAIVFGKHHNEPMNKDNFYVSQIWWKSGYFYGKARAFGNSNPRKNKCQYANLQTT